MAGSLPLPAGFGVFFIFVLDRGVFLRALHAVGDLFTCPRERRRARWFQGLPHCLKGSLRMTSPRLSSSKAASARASWGSGVCGSRDAYRPTTGLGSSTLDLPKHESRPRLSRSMGSSLFWQVPPSASPIRQMYSLRSGDWDGRG